MDTTILLTFIGFGITVIFFFLDKIMVKMPKWIAVIGFIFGALLILYGMLGIIYPQLRIEKTNPYFIIEDTKISQRVDNDNRRLMIIAQATFTNKGDKPAYKLKLNRAYAPLEVKTPEELFVEPEEEIADAINVGESAVITFRITSPLLSDYDKPTVRSSALLIYARLDFSDAPIKGKQFKDERWFAYALNDIGLSFMKPEIKERFEKNIREVYSGVHLNE